FGLDHRPGVPVAPQVARAGASRRSRPHDRDAFSGWLPRLEQLEPLLYDVIGRVALEQCDLDRLLVTVVQDARPLAQHFDGTCPRARMPERVRVENHACRAAQIAAGDLLDEGRDVDVRGAGDRAGCVVTVEAL